jgi:quinoprotein glucose dehydrogenase
MAIALGLGISSGAQPGAANGDWAHYSGDKGSSKYSPLSQIDASNVGDLEEAWRWTADPVHPEARPATGFKATPLVVDGIMYVPTSYSQVVALNPGTGEMLWMYETDSYKAGRPGNVGFQHRGLEYWTDGEKKRILIATGGRQLISIDVETGKPDPEFGNNGVVNLLEGLGKKINERAISYSAPPVVCKDVIIIGSIINDGTATKSQPPGHIRGFDVRTGEQKWIFHTIPQPGEFGNETWENGSWEYTGGANSWTMMSVDEELGYVYCPTGTSTSDFYGEFRHGDNLFAESLLCLNAETGERVWHFQMIHHGMWDWDLPSAPNLVDIVVDGKPIKAVTQMGKNAFIYVFDRVTGEPVWPIEERPVPQSTVPGEKSSATQPFPTKPPAFDRQGVTLDNLIDYTPELRAEALKILEDYTWGPMYMPPSLVTETNKGTALLPHINGGSNWMGACLDPETGIIYIPSQTRMFVMGVRPDELERTEFSHIGALSGIPGPQGLPMVKPPYGRITAMDLNKGEILWIAPHGDGPRDHPAIKHLNLGPLGESTNGGLAHGGGVLTKTLLFMSQPKLKEDFYTTDNGYLRAFNKENGAVVWEYSFDNLPQGTPMTYMHEGKQYLVTALGGGRRPSELVALRLK